MKRAHALVTLGLIVSCDPVLPEVGQTPPAGVAEVELVLDPDDRGAEVVRLALIGKGTEQIAPADVWLGEGVVSEVSLRRWAEGDPPKTLVEHKIPSTTFVDGEALRLIPHEPLTLALEHSVIVRGGEVEGTAHTFWTAESAPAHAQRVWPPGDVEVEVEGETEVAFEVEAAHAVFCAAVATTFDAPAGAVSLEPSGPRGRFSVLGDRCVIFEPEPQEEPQSGVFHPPRSFGGVDLDPAPIRLGAAAAVDVPPLACALEEQAVGPLCALVQDDRVRFRADARVALYAVEAGGLVATHVGGAEGESTFEVRGLMPNTAVDVTVRWFAADHTDQVLAELRTTLPQPHIDLSEVMADPDGPEPEQEWIELHNDGLVAVDLAGFVLADAAGEVEITTFQLDAGARVILVREGFEDPSLDPSRVVVLPSLGGNGLSNAGEALELRAATGAALSTFPAAPKPKPGVSTSLFVDASGARSWVHTEPTPLAEFQGAL